MKGSAYERCVGRKTSDLSFILLLQALQRRPIDVERPGARVQRAQPSIKEKPEERDLDAHHRPQRAYASLRASVSRLPAFLATTASSASNLSLPSTSCAIALQVTSVLLFRRRKVQRLLRTHASIIPSRSRLHVHRAALRPCATRRNRAQCCIIAINDGRSPASRFAQICQGERIERPRQSRGLCAKRLAAPPRPL